jgi:hypothetical protein
VAAVSEDWFYSDAGQQVGPVCRDHILAMLSSGALGPSTLSWTQGMAGWEAAEVVFANPSARAVAPDERLASRATWSLILGLVSIFGLFVPIMLPAAIVGLVFGIRSLHSSKRRTAIAGIVLSSMGLLIEVWLLYMLVDVLQHGGWEQLMLFFRQG